MEKIVGSGGGQSKWAERRALRAAKKAQISSGKGSGSQSSGSGNGCHSSGKASGKQCSNNQSQQRRGDIRKGHSYGYKGQGQKGQSKGYKGQSSCYEASASPIVQAAQAQELVNQASDPVAAKVARLEALPPGTIVEEHYAGRSRRMRSMGRGRFETLVNGRSVLLQTHWSGEWMMG